MNRRRFLTTSCVGTLAGLAGCSTTDSIGGGSDDDSVRSGKKIDPEDQSRYTAARRIAFVDREGTLGHLGDADKERARTYTNEYSESDWQELSRNDIDVARETLADNAGAIEDLRPYARRAVAQSPEAEPAERALIRGIGRGIDEETVISSSTRSARVLKPVAQQFADELLESEAFDVWTTASTTPLAEGKFAYRSLLVVAYLDDETYVRDYVEAAVPRTTRLRGVEDDAVRRPEASVYADEDELAYVAGYEFSKAWRAADAELIEQADEFIDPIPANRISRATMLSLKGLVDSADNDVRYDGAPNRGLVVAVSRQFGESVERAFYENWSQETRRTLEYVGRGLHLFFEAEGGAEYLGIDGTVDNPRLYVFQDFDGMEAAWENPESDFDEL